MHTEIEICDAWRDLRGQGSMCYDVLYVSCYVNLWRLWGAQRGNACVESWSPWRKSLTAPLPSLGNWLAMGPWATRFLHTAIDTYGILQSMTAYRRMLKDLSRIARSPINTFVYYPATLVDFSLFDPFCIFFELQVSYFHGLATLATHIMYIINYVCFFICFTGQGIGKEVIHGVLHCLSTAKGRFGWHDKATLLQTVSWSHNLSGFGGWAWLSERAPFDPNCYAHCLTYRPAWSMFTYFIH